MATPVDVSPQGAREYMRRLYRRGEISEDPASWPSADEIRRGVRRMQQRQPTPGTGDGGSGPGPGDTGDGATPPSKRFSYPDSATRIESLERRMETSTEGTLDIEGVGPVEKSTVRPALEKWRERGYRYVQFTDEGLSPVSPSVETRNIDEAIRAMQRTPEPTSRIQGYGVVSEEETLPMFKRWKQQGYQSLETREAQGKKDEMTLRPGSPRDIDVKQILSKQATHVLPRPGGKGYRNVGLTASEETRRKLQDVDTLAGVHKALGIPEGYMVHPDLAEELAGHDIAVGQPRGEAMQQYIQREREEHRRMREMRQADSRPPGWYKRQAERIGDISGELATEYIGHKRMDLWRRDVQQHGLGEQLSQRPLSEVASDVRGELRRQERREEFKDLEEDIKGAVSAETWRKIQPYVDDLSYSSADRFLHAVKDTLSQGEFARVAEPVRAAKEKVQKDVGKRWSQIQQLRKAFIHPEKYTIEGDQGKLGWRSRRQGKPEGVPQVDLDFSVFQQPFEEGMHPIGEVTSKYKRLGALRGENVFQWFPGVENRFYDPDEGVLNRSAVEEYYDTGSERYRDLYSTVAIWKKRGATQVRVTDEGIKPVYPTVQPGDIETTLTNLPAEPRGSVYDNLVNVAGVGTIPQEDLRSTLQDWQEAGFEEFTTTGEGIKPDVAELSLPSADGIEQGTYTLSEFKRRASGRQTAIEETMAQAMFAESDMIQVPGRGMVERQEAIDYLEGLITPYGTLTSETIPQWREQGIQQVTVTEEGTMQPSVPTIESRDIDTILTRMEETPEEIAHIPGYGTVQESNIRSTLEEWQGRGIQTVRYTGTGENRQMQPDVPTLGGDETRITEDTLIGVSGVIARMEETPEDVISIGGRTYRESEMKPTLEDWQKRGITGFRAAQIEQDGETVQKLQPYIPSIKGGNVEDVQREIRLSQGDVVSLDGQTYQKSSLQPTLQGWEQQGIQTFTVTETETGQQLQPDIPTVESKNVSDVLTQMEKTPEKVITIGGQTYQESEIQPTLQSWKKQGITRFRTEEGNLKPVIEAVTIGEQPTQPSLDTERYIGAYAGEWETYHQSLQDIEQRITGADKPYVQMDGELYRTEDIQQWLRGTEEKPGALQQASSMETQLEQADERYITVTPGEEGIQFTGIEPQWQLEQGLELIAKPWSEMTPEEHAAVASYVETEDIPHGPMVTHQPEYVETMTAEGVERHLKPWNIGETIRPFIGSPEQEAWQEFQAKKQTGEAITAAVASGEPLLGAIQRQGGEAWAETMAVPEEDYYPSLDVQQFAQTTGAQAFKAEVIQEYEEAGMPEVAKQFRHPIESGVISIRGDAEIAPKSLEAIYPTAKGGFQFKPKTKQQVRLEKELEETEEFFKLKATTPLGKAGEITTELGMMVGQAFAQPLSTTYGTIWEAATGHPEKARRQWTKGRLELEKTIEKPLEQKEIGFGIKLPRGVATPLTSAAGSIAATYGASAAIGGGLGVTSQFAPRIAKAAGIGMGIGAGAYIGYEVTQPVGAKKFPYVKPSATPKHVGVTLASAGTHLPFAVAGFRAGWAKGAGWAESKMYEAELKRQMRIAEMAPETRTPYKDVLVRHRAARQLSKILQQQKPKYVSDVDIGSASRISASQAKLFNRVRLGTERIGGSLSHQTQMHPEYITRMPRDVELLISRRHMPFTTRAKIGMKRAFSLKKPSTLYSEIQTMKQPAIRQYQQYLRKQGLPITTPEGSHIFDVHIAPKPGRYFRMGFRTKTPRRIGRYTVQPIEEQVFRKGISSTQLASEYRWFKDVPDFANISRSQIRSMVTAGAPQTSITHARALLHQYTHPEMYTLAERVPSGANIPSVTRYFEGAVPSKYVGGTTSIKPGIWGKIGDITGSRFPTSMNVGYETYSQYFGGIPTPPITAPTTYSLSSTFKSSMLEATTPYKSYIQPRGRQKPIQSSYIDTQRPSAISDIGMASTPSLSITQPSSVSMPSERPYISQPSNILQPSDISTVTQPSYISQPSNILQPSDISTVTQPSYISQPSGISHPSGVTRPSGVSILTEGARISQPSFTIDPSRPSGFSGITDALGISNIKVQPFTSKIDVVDKSTAPQPAAVSRVSRPSEILSVTTPSTISQPSPPSPTSGLDILDISKVDIKDITAITSPPPPKKPRRHIAMEHEEKRREEPRGKKVKYADELEKTLFADILSVQGVQAVTGGKAYHPEPTEKIWETGREKAYISVPTVEHLERGYRHRPKMSLGMQELTKEMGMTGKPGVSLENMVGGKKKKSSKKKTGGIQWKNLI